MTKSSSLLHGLFRNRCKGTSVASSMTGFIGRHADIGITLQFSQLCFKLYMSWDQHISVSGSTWKTILVTHD